LHKIRLLYEQDNDLYEHPEEEAHDRVIIPVINKMIKAILRFFIPGAKYPGPVNRGQHI